MSMFKFLYLYYYLCKTHQSAAIFAHLSDKTIRINWNYSMLPYYDKAGDCSFTRETENPSICGKLI